MSVLLNLAVALVAGLLMTRLVKHWHLPDVTAFLIAGVLIGPFALGRLGGVIGFADYDEVAKYDVISQVAMGFIAFSIGSEFRLSQLKKTGKAAFVIGVVQSVIAVIMVDAALIAFHFLFPEIISLPAAITLGAIASATAPAATLMVVRQFKAKGELTNLLLPIVALDDAVGLVVFAVSFGIAKVMSSGEINVLSIVLEPIIEIVCSLLLGVLAGYVLTKLEKLFHSNTNRNSLATSFVILTAALATISVKAGPVTVGFSPLLTCMMLGTVFCNICDFSDEIMMRSEKWSSPVLACFFVLSGAALRLEVFGNYMLIILGAVYILFRSAGKYFGAKYSAKSMKCSPNVIKYLGITLLPQAGVALGMCVTAQELGKDGELIRNIILFSVLIYELVGPLMTKKALKAAGEIYEKPADKTARRKNA